MKIDLTCTMLSQVGEVNKIWMRKVQKNEEETDDKVIQVTDQPSSLQF